MTKLSRGKSGLVIFGLSANLVSLVSFLGQLSCASHPGSGQRFELEEEASGSAIRVSELYVIDADGSNPTRLKAIGFAPRWSPHGSQIVFQWNEQDITTKDIRSEIRTVNADGSGLRTLFGDLMSRGGPMGYGAFWSLDGDRIAFYIWREGKRKIGIINTDGGELKVVEQLAEPFLGFGFSPDGKKQIVPTQNDEIYVVQLDSGHRTLVGIGRGAVWSPDSAQIVFSQLDGEISMVNVDGSGLTRLGRKGFTPAMSPDGNKIVFVVTEKTLNPRKHGPDNLYLMDSDGSNYVRLTSSPTDEGSPAWSPDGKKIVFVVEHESRGIFSATSK